MGRKMVTVQASTVIDEYTRECNRSHGGSVCEKGMPEHMRSGNGSEFTAKAVRDWLERLKVFPLIINPRMER